VSSVLNVEFKTRIIEEPESVIAKHGETVTFSSCLAESNSELEYIWVRGDNEKIVGVSQHLTLTADDDTEDVYKCKVFVAGEELVSRPAHLRLIRAPVLRVSEERLVSVGDDIILQCHVSSLDSRTRVIWTRNNVPLDRDSLKHRSLKYDNNVDLVIYNVNINDFGEYGCFAENTVGHDQKNVVLEEFTTSVFVNLITTIPTVAVIAAIIIMIVMKRKLVIKKIQQLLNPNHQDYQLPEHQDHVRQQALDPIYRGHDQAVFEVLLNSGMDEKEYLRQTEDYFDKIPRR